MKRIYVLSGPTGAGKNTTAQIFAKQFQRSAIVDFDAIRAMFVQPHHTPWDGEAGKQQDDITRELVCTIANRLVSDDRTVVILDPVTDQDITTYRSILKHDVYIVQLLPSWQTMLERNNERAKREGGHRLTPQQLEYVYAEQQKLTAYDQLIDNSDLTPEETAAAITIESITPRDHALIVG